MLQKFVIYDNIISMNTNYDVIIIGGGASGMMCSIFAARNGYKTLVLDHNEKLGKKLYITGKKIELAQKMLAENLSVEEVSKQLYFSNAEYFRKVFVSTCGISPQKYKNQMQNKS